MGERDKEGVVLKLEREIKNLIFGSWTLEESHVETDILRVECILSISFCVFAYTSKLGSCHMHRHPNPGPSCTIPEK